MLRSEFDLMMMDNARGKGAEVEQGVSVHQVHFSGDRATGVQVKYRNGQIKDVSASVIVDATGRSENEKNDKISRLFRES